MKTYIGCLVPKLDFIYKLLQKYKLKDTHLLINEEISQNYEDIEYLINFGKPLSKNEFEKYKSLKFIQLLTAGYEHIDVKALKNKSIAISTNNGANATAVAEHTILLILALLKKLSLLQKNAESGKWQQSPPAINELIELEGKIIGLIGFGQIGQKVATRLLPFGVKVAYYDIRKIPKSEYFNNSIKKEALNKIFETSDIISLHTSLTKSSFHMIDDHAISLMKKGVFIINTCRGEVVDEKAIISGLKSNQIGGIGFDVFKNEPLTINPYQEFSNVIITPHRAGSTTENWQTRIQFAFENICRFKDSKTPWALI